ncbi:PREDICTED: uncharacterized protein LOC106303003 [Brassica oleracea var. oleracea]|uniref:uncharacterized protein LOC106303003 n=1 Tax=Brassica oleracea var. oleracea TaxID=109376 RepID=UPI0006A74C9A|nr:PREDICTED: uncharacterized protein LOC106303003 [Brassica oleracea var. oleracea]
MLTASVLSEEVKSAAFSIKEDSAPGADGLTGTFYKRFWSIVGATTVQEVQSFFQTTILPAGWNHTYICLLPKVNNPSRLTKMRPISLCSVHYKIISKILCNRLKIILPDIVSDIQGAFVSGRLITDNILVAHEMVRALRTKDGVDSDFMAIKTDMSKAYDHVEWCFVECLLERMGFDRKWVTWISACIGSVTYSVLLNGSQHGFIKPERGLRQGDPLSPFLFILCAEAQVSTLNQAEILGKLNGIRLSREGPAVHHLLFADDSLLLCKAMVDEGTELVRRLKLYGDASGQLINTSKSSIIFGSKVPPLRLKGGGSKILSQGGKEIILKSVGMALPVFAMSCFRLPKDLCAKLTSIMTEFWWGGTAERKKIPWVAWKKLCKPKDIGGMGFKDLAWFNQALLCKQAWRIWSNPQSLLSRVMKSRYFKQGNFLDCPLWYRPSYAWKSIVHGRELLSSPRYRIDEVDLTLKVSDLIDERYGTWDAQRVRHLFLEEDANQILGMRPQVQCPDTMVWGFSRNGVYDSQSGYTLLHLLQTVENPVAAPSLPPIEKRLWSNLWKPETICHVLFHCPVAKEVWRLSEFPTPAAGFFTNSFFLNFHHLLETWADEIWKKSQLESEAWSAANVGDKEDIDENTGGSALACWQKPCPSFIKCNIGSSWTDANRNCGVAWLTRNHCGAPLIHSRCSYSMVASSLEAELFIFLWATESISTLRHENVVFESTSYLAGEAVLSPDNFPQFRVLIDTIREKLSRLQLWSIAYVHSEANRCADAIARSVTRDHRYASYIEKGGPSWLLPMIRADAVDTVNGY